MKLKKIINTDGLQVYQIINPSKKFKLEYPFKYICISINQNNDTVSIHGFNQFPLLFAFKSFIGYIFTYESKIPSFIVSNKKYNNIITVFPECLDQYFISDNDKSPNIDIVLKILCKNTEIPIQFSNPLILRVNTKTLCDNIPIKNENRDTIIKSIRTNVINAINNILNDNYNDAPNNDIVEEWLINFINEPLINNNNLPVNYPKNISNETFKHKANMKLSDISIAYDFRAKQYNQENLLISIIEDAFEKSNRNVNIYNSYNNILTRVKTELDKKHYKYIDHDQYITTKLKYIRDINVSYKITDFI